MQQTEYLTNQSDTVALIQEDSVFETMPLGIQSWYRLYHSILVVWFWLNPLRLPSGAAITLPFRIRPTQGELLDVDGGCGGCRFLQIGGTWNHPNLDCFRIETHGLGIPHDLRNLCRWMNYLNLPLLKMVIFPMWKNQRLIHSIPFRHICVNYPSPGSSPIRGMWISFNFSLFWWTQRFWSSTHLAPTPIWQTLL